MRSHALQLPRVQQRCASGQLSRCYADMTLSQTKERLMPSGCPQIQQKIEDNTSRLSGNFCSPTGFSSSRLATAQQRKYRYTLCQASVLVKALRTANFKQTYKTCLPRQGLFRRRSYAKQTLTRSLASSPRSRHIQSFALEAAKAAEFVRWLWKKQNDPDSHTRTVG